MGLVGGLDLHVAGDPSDADELRRKGAERGWGGVRQPLPNQSPLDGPVIVRRGKEGEWIPLERFASDLDIGLRVIRDELARQNGHTATTVSSHCLTSAAPVC